MEYLDNECERCGGEIINDPDTGKKICKHCGVELKSSTSILGRFNTQNTSPQQTNQSQTNQQEQQSSEPEQQLSAL